MVSVSAGPLRLRQAKLKTKSQLALPVPSGSFSTYGEDNPKTLNPETLGGSRHFAKPHVLGYLEVHGQL